MKTTFAVLASLAAMAAAQGVTEVITPTGSAPQGCATSSPGQFTITVLNVTSAAKRSLEERQQAGILTLTLQDGILKDQAGRTAYIASNYQFQFDAPPQAGALSTAGYSLCSNGSLALGPTTVFWQCTSGDILNLYDRDWAEQCIPVHLQRREGTNSPTVVTQISDGQPQPTVIPVTQISDGQPQGPTAGAPVTQISDGQPQGPTGAPVTQISDGQPQGPTAGPPVTQISDGQPQAPTGAPVTQISDGQPQAPTAGAPVTQISDGQPQAPNATLPSATPPPVFTGAAAFATPFIGAFAAGIAGAVALL